MSSRNQVLTNNVNSFPNNNSGQITPQVLRDFNADFVNSTVFLDQTSSMSVSSASYASNATSASFATNATSASFALTASFALNAGGATVNTGSLLVTASAVFSTITFTKGDGSTFDVTVAQSGSVATASLALNSERLGGVLPSGYVTTAATSSFATKTELNAYTASTNTFTSSIQTQVNAFQAATSSYVTNAQTSSMSVLSASFATTASFASTAAQATSASFATNAASAATATSASYATTAGFAQTLATGLNITASNILVTNNLIVNGTASFGYTRTTSGSAVMIGDEFIILNADTPFAPFAGIKVYDTGSASTASLEWNGNGDYWIQVDEAGESAAMLTGASGSKGSEVFPTSNRLIKGTGNSTVVNSNITDTGTLVTINSNTTLSGSVNVSGSLVMNGLSPIQASHVKASDVQGLEILTNGNATVATFGQGGGTGATFAGQVNAVAFSGSGALVTGVISSSFATTASFAQNAVSASFAPSTPTFPFTGSAGISGSLPLVGSLDVVGGGSFTQQVTFATSSRVTFVMDSPTQSLSLTNHNALNELMIVNNEANEKIIGFDYDRWTTIIKYGLETGVDFRGIDTLSGKLNITSSTGLIGTTGSLVDIAGTTTFTGSLIGKPQSFQTTERPFPILEASDGTSTGGNIITSRSTQATATGSVHVTGSNNYVSLANGLSNTFVTNGRGAIVRGTNSIFLGAAPQITGSNGSGYDRPAPTFATSINAGGITITDNRPTTTTAPLSFSANNNNGAITATLSTGSIAFGNNMMFGSTGTIINVTGSAGAARAINSSILGSFSGNRIEFDGSGGNVISSVLVGQFITASFTDTNTTLNSVSVLGYQLAVSGSGPAGSTTLYGSTYVGRWNAQDSTSQPGLTTFAVGTGTSNAARRTSLHVSASGLTTISSLSATGSLLGTASFADNATSASFAVTASYALNAGGIQASDIYSYSFLLMGA